MIKQMVGAVAFTAASIVGANALEDRNNLNLNYTDAGSYYTELDELYNNFDSDNAVLSLDGRNGIIEYGASVDSDNIQSVNVGVVLPVGPIGLVAGIESDDKVIDKSGDYYGIVFEKGRIEARYTYQDNADDHKVSGRLYLTSKFGVNAGVRFQDWQDVGEDTEYTVGVTYKF